LIEEIDFTPVKKWLDEKKAKEKLDVLKENINKLKSKYDGSEIDMFEVQEGETLRDVMTKYTVMASLIEKRIEEEEKKNTDHKVVTKRAVWLRGDSGYKPNFIFLKIGRADYSKWPFLKFFQLVPRLRF